MPVLIALLFCVILASSQVGNRSAYSAKQARGNPAFVDGVKT